MVDYFHDADDEFLALLGADRAKFPDREEWRTLVVDDLPRPPRERRFDYVVWQVDEQPVGHCNIGRIEYGRHAFLHLHLWDDAQRGRGVGSRLLTDSLRHFCSRYELEEILSEPHAVNPGPNRTMARVGFELIRSYDTTPGWINTHQTVNRWRIRCPVGP